MPDKRQTQVTEDGEFIVVKTTLLDFPGRVAACVFLPGCHLRCPYCHNPDLVIPRQAESSAKGSHGSLNENVHSFREFLRRRASVLGGVVFSGGEALLHPLLGILVKLVKTHHLKVKIDTAGLLPDALEGLIEDGLVDYVAMDLKTTPARYGELGWKGTGKRSADVLMKRTLDLLKNSGIDYEARTTVVPPLVDSNVLSELAEMTRNVPRWVWQIYRRGITLNPDWGNIKAPGEDELKGLLRELNPKTSVIIR